MAAAAGLLADLGKLQSKQQANTDAMLRLVDATAAAVEARAAASASSEAATAAKANASAIATTEAILPKLADQHKTYHAAVSKFTKLADRAFHEGPPLPVRPHLQLDAAAVDELAALHLYREGRPRAAAKLLEEAGLAELAAFLEGGYEGLRALQEVLAAVAARRDLGPACRWAEVHREGLRALGSSLEFQLARLQFLSLLQPQSPPPQPPGSSNGQEGQDRVSEGNGDEDDFPYAAALAFARERLAPFLSPSPSATSPCLARAAKPEQVQALMGCLLYAGRLERSPYRALLGPSLWQDAMETLHRDGCRLLGLPSESPLSVCYRAAACALGPLEKMRRVVESSRGDWDGLAELPGEIELIPSLRFHSVFSCPVTRELASPANPPVALKCGHVLCRNSIARLTQRGGDHSSGGGGRLKCPTCPTEQSAEDARELYF